MSELTDIRALGHTATGLVGDRITVTDRRLNLDERPGPAASVAELAEQRAVPRHVALIMDGNGRWATRRGEERIVGHEAGELAIVAAIDAALDARVRWLTLFAFSTENWNRPPGEVDFLMEFNRRLIEKHGAAYYERGVRFRYMGERNPPVPAAVADAMTSIELATADASALTLTFAFNYGARHEIVRACQRLIDAAVDANEIDEARFGAALQYPDTPDPDVIVRTAGEYRLSNFLLWEAAYAELVFLELPWPDFRASDFQDVLQTYAERTRTFGAVHDVSSASEPTPPPDHARSSAWTA